MIRNRIKPHRPRSSSSSFVRSCNADCAVRRASQRVGQSRAGRTARLERRSQCFRRAFVLLLLGGTVIWLSICSAQIQPPPASPSRYVEIKLPDGVPSESIFIRYVLDADDFGDWVQQRPSVSSYLIEMNRAGHQATRIRAILYAPGCAIQTMDLALSGSNSQQYSFACQPLPSIWISGNLTRQDRLYRHEVSIRANYVARWAQSFLGLGAGIVTTIPVGDVVNVSPNGSFRLLVPDFSRDPSAGAPDYPGELQLWARDRTNDEVLAQLIPVGVAAAKTRMGGLRIQSAYPSDMVFAPCAANPPLLHDAFGFALRPDVNDACDR
jgi:hypothetical protein